MLTETLNGLCCGQGWGFAPTPCLWFKHKTFCGEDNEENPSTPVMLSQVPFKIRISSDKVGSFCGLGESVTTGD